jgi:hypothetical protein
MNGRVGERLVHRGEESGFDLQQTGRAHAFDADSLTVSTNRPAIHGNSDSPLARTTLCPTRSQPSTAKCCLANLFGSDSQSTPAPVRRSWQAS